MSKPSKIASLSQEVLLNKYTQEGWETRLKAFKQETKDRVWNASGPTATVRKRIISTLDADGDLAAHVVCYTRADGSACTVVTLLVDGDTAYYASHEA